MLTHLSITVSLDRRFATYEGGRNKQASFQIMLEEHKSEGMLKCRQMSKNDGVVTMLPAKETKGVNKHAYLR